MERIANRYRILEKLGQGGMGVVYRALDESDGGEVALKMLIGPTKESSESVRLRFKEEFRMMAALDHNNLVRVYDFGVSDGTLFLTMEIIPGRELTALRGAVSWKELAGILAQVCQALSFIHARGFVHRDIKAENIRITDEGTVKVMDFGLMDPIGLPADGKIHGTIGYLPPEVAAGGIIDASSDLYSVGCLAYELAAGRLPFSGGSTLDIIKAHINRPPQALYELKPDIPAELEAIIHKLLEKKPDARYRTASEAIKELSEYSGVMLLGSTVEEKSGYLRASVLVGRQTELQELTDGLKAVQRAESRSVYVTAPAGLGKSRLVHEFKLRAKLDEIPLVEGRCPEGALVPFQAIAPILDQLLRDSSEAELERWGPQLTILLPSLKDRYGPSETSTDMCRQKERLFDAVRAWLASLAEHRPCVMFFDDAQWSDSQSIELLNNIVRADIKGLFVVVSFRDDEVPADSPLWYGLDEKRASRIPLAPFDEAQSKTLLEAMLSSTVIDPSTSRRLFHASAGNPFFLTEILRFLVERNLLEERNGVWVFPDENAIALPDSVQAIVIKRWETLGSEARKLAVICAALGKELTREELFSLLDIDEELAFAAIDSLISTRFLTRTENGFAFPHDRIREAVLAAEDEAHLRKLHHRIARFLEERHPDTDSILNRLAYHFGRSHDSHKAFHYHYRASRLARENGAIAEAIHLMAAAERSLEAIEVPGREAILVELWHSIGMYACEAKPHLAETMLKKEIAFLHAQGNIRGVVKALKHLVKGIRRLPPSVGEPVLQKLNEIKPYKHVERHGLRRVIPPFYPTLIPRLVEAYAFLMSTYCFSCRYVEGAELGEEVLSLLPDPDAWSAGLVKVAMGANYSHSGQLKRLYELGDQVWEQIRDVTANDYPTIAFFKVWTLFFRNVRGWIGLKTDPALDVQALELIREGSAQLGGNTLHHLEGWCYYLSGFPDVLSGRYASFMEKEQRALDAFRKAGSVSYGMLHAVSLLAHGLIERGDFAEAQAMLRTALDVLKLQKEVFSESWIEALYGRLKLAADELPAAEEHFLNAIQLAEGQSPWCGMRAKLGLASLRIKQSRFDEALLEAREVLALAEGDEYYNPYKRIVALRTIAEAKLGRGDTGDALDQINAALVLALELDNPIQAGFCRTLLGRIMHARGDVAGAHKSYLAAKADFEGIDNAYQARRLMPLLRALQTPTAVSVVPMAAKTQNPTERLSQFATVLSRVSHGLTLDGTELKDALGSLLSDCIKAIGADAGSVYEADTNGVVQWIHSERYGVNDEQKANPLVLEEVIRTDKGVCTIDYSEEELSAGSQLGVTLRYVVAASCKLVEGRKQIFYLVRENAADPFDPVQLSELEAMLAHAGRMLTV